MRLLALALLLLPAALRAQSFNVPPTPSSTTYTNGLPQRVILTSATIVLPVVLSSSQTIVVVGSTIAVTQGGPINVGQVGVFVVTPSTNAFSINGISNYRTDNYAAAGTGTTVNVSSSPLRTFSVQVTGTGASATSWDVLLEGSLNGVNFTTLMEHTEALGNGVALFSGTNLQPVLYYRSRVVAVTLGAASAIAVTALGVQ